jgi:hypothetical protein
MATIITDKMAKRAIIYKPFTEIQKPRGYSNKPDFSDRQLHNQKQINNIEALGRIPHQGF